MSSQYTPLDLARDVMKLVAEHGSDGPKLLEGLREPYTKILACDLSKAGVKRQGNHIDNSKYLYYDGVMSITFDQLPKGKYIPPHDHGVWEAMGIYSGQLKHVVYDRLDDGTKEGYADLQSIDDRILERNDTAIVAPPAEIHSFEALTDDTFAVTIVGGRYKEDRAYYKPEKKSYVRLNPKKDTIVYAA
ncbi:MAG: putative metal-dependent enzyme (double-stranded beta helix superfamily) [Gammaproteobacteria bacterium]|jgi:predicted metal-dependent enzyme (double-stranded beta helix superfamily)